MQIESGIGKPVKAGVTDGYRLMAEALDLSIMSDCSVKGDGFIISSGIITLTTTTSFNGVLYFKNTNLGHMLFIERITLSSNQAAQWRTYRNPTTGTLVSSGTAFDPVNTNFSSGSKFIGTSLRGANALTITDGVQIAPVIQAAGVSTFEISGAFIVDDNNSFAIDCKPGLAADIVVNIHCYLKKK